MAMRVVDAIAQCCRTGNIFLSQKFSLMDDAWEHDGEVSDGLDGTHNVGTLVTAYQHPFMTGIVDSDVVINLIDMDLINLPWRALGTQGVMLVGGIGIRGRGLLDVKGALLLHNGAVIVHRL